MLPAARGNTRGLLAHKQAYLPNLWEESKGLRLKVVVRDIKKEICKLQNNSSPGRRRRIQGFQFCEITFDLVSERYGGREAGLDFDTLTQLHLEFPFPSLQLNPR